MNSACDLITSGKLEVHKALAYQELIIERLNKQNGK
jgi:hypothetical protein